MNDMIFFQAATSAFPPSLWSATPSSCPTSRSGGASRTKSYCEDWAVDQSAYNTCTIFIAQLLLWTHNIFQGLSCYKNIFYVQVILLILLLVIMILKQDWLFDWMEILKYTHLFSGVQFFSIRIQLWDKMQYVRHVQRFQSCVGPVQHLPLLISYWAEHM